MLLRNSFSNTKKLFQKTLQSFKSFFSSADSSSYRRMPKASPFTNPYSSYTPPLATDAMNIAIQTSFNKNKELNKFYTDISHRWDDSHKGKAKKKIKNNKIIPPPPPSPPAQQEKDDALINGSFMKFSKVKSVKSFQAGKRWQGNSSSDYKERSFLVAQKLKELEMIDISNVDHVLDIEEVLHYYSRLTCPAYLDIVDKFFMDMYVEFLGPTASPTPRSVSSGPTRLPPSVRS